MTDYITKLGAKFIETTITGTKELSPTDHNPCIFMNTSPIPGPVTTPYTNDAWVTVDLSEHVPVGTKWATLTGVVFITNPVNDETNITVAFRKPGETTDYGYLLQGFAENTDGCRENVCITVPVSEDREVEMKVRWWASTQTWPVYPNGPAWGMNLQVIQYGRGDAPNQPPEEEEEEPPVESWHSVFTTTMGLNGSGMQNHTIVTAINGPFSHAATKIRIKVAPNSSQYGNVIINDCWIGKKANSGDAYDFDGTQVRVKFSGNNGVTLTQGGSLTLSDEATISFSTGDDILVAFNLGNSPAMGAGANAAITSYFKASSATAGDTNKSGFTAVSGYSYLVGELEFYS